MKQETNNLPTYVPVLIVGAGPIGLAAGNLLGQAGIATLILERNEALSSIPRAISLDDEGLRICQALGLHEVLLPHMLVGIDAHYLSKGRFLAKVSPTHKMNGFPFISTFYQPDFEKTLYEGLRRFECVDLCFQHTVETFEQNDASILDSRLECPPDILDEPTERNDSHITVSVRLPDGRLNIIECSYLLACDGARSTIRRTLSIPLKPVIFPPALFRNRKRAQNSKQGQKWLVIDSVADKDTSTAVQFFCNPQRPAMTILAPQQRRRWEFMLLPGEDEKAMLQPECIAALLQQLGKLDMPQIARTAIYTFQSALATHLAQDRIFLLGDAAHLMPPFGGQGMNSGLRDAHNLCWKLSLVLRGIAHSAILQSYAEERYPHILQMIRFSSFLGSVIMPTSPHVALLRDILFTMLNTLPPVRDIFTELRIKPQPRYTKGFFLSDGSLKSNRLRGLMLPQPEILTSDGKTRLLDDVLGPGFALLRFSEQPDEAFATIHPNFWKQLNTRFICLSPNLSFAHALNRVDSSPVTVIQSKDRDFLRHYRNVYVVVRPDRFILGVFHEERADRFVGDFRKMLQNQA